MARLHLRFQLKSYEPHLVELTERFFASHPWSGSDRDRGRKFDTWLHGAAMVYGLPYPSLVVTPPQHRPKGQSVGRYDPDTATIHLQRFSVISLFHQFRHHMQACTTENWTHDNEATAQDAQEWACSLFYRLQPRRFRRFVRRGRVAGVKPADLLKKRAS